MSLLFENAVLHDGTLGIWKIEENEAYFLSRLTLSDAEAKRLSQIKGEGRRIQWLAVRYLLHHLSGRNTRIELAKDEHGKPYLSDSDYFISISHSHEMAAVIAAKVPCGVDIQYPVEKIKRLVPKFCADHELNAIDSEDDLSTMHVIWGAKECIYKAYGLRGLDYRRHLAIMEPDKLFERPGLGSLKKNTTHIEYDIFAERVLDYTLTYCFEKRPV